MIKNANKKIALIGNPNVGKSTIFNNLTGLNQHTGNWTGKTVDSAYGFFNFNNNTYKLIDLPGTYSLVTTSKEEEVSRDYICFHDYDLIIIVIDSTMLKRNLNLAEQILEINKNTILCLNLNDEALKKKIYIDEKEIQNIINIPVIKISANNKKDINRLISLIDKTINNSVNDFKITYNEKIENAIKKINIILNNHHKNKKNRFFAIKLLENDKTFNDLIYEYLNLNKEQKEATDSIINMCLNYLRKNDINYEYEIASSITKKSNEIYSKACNQKKYNVPKIDKILTSKVFGLPIMLLFLLLILWLTIVGANYPSIMLSKVLFKLNEIISTFLINIKTPKIIHDLIINGVLTTLFWIVSVMLPPMAIFFPLFTLLEDLGFLPRIAFNLDRLFKKAKCHGKQSLSMCMGLGCNACGVIGTRIIDSPRERLVAIITNSLIPCNGRFPALIAIITMFFSLNNNILSGLILSLLIVLSIIFTLITSKILASTILKNKPSSFVLEIPPYRKPNIKKVIIRSIYDRIIFVLSRAIVVAMPAGIIIWILSNIAINDISLLNHLTNALNPIASIFGLDGVILIAFILGFPANEIVIPIIIMAYLKTSSLTDYNNLFELKKLLIENNWTIKTALCTLLFMLFHFPCSTTLITIKKEVKSFLWTFISFITPLIVGLMLCFFINIIFTLF